ncbi:hypothetical protein FLONG3_3436 [Fusarium longipes]|uniref:Uncharacterized protein n=1 Tax=Fusarium longipes TaxID=694270 RepID=A0A395T284_9HYPO|nr:hypothetical protein FLONG3_3436 [Fusarium longipes]
MPRAKKPPASWAPLPKTASNEEKDHWNQFIDQWTKQEEVLASEEEAWQKISLRLGKKATTNKIFNHFVGKTPTEDITWGHIVAAIILFGKNNVKSSTFGKRAQQKFPESSIVTMQYNTSGATLSDTTIVSRGPRGSSENPKTHNKGTSRKTGAKKDMEVAPPPNVPKPNRSGFFSKDTNNNASRSSRFTTHKLNNHIANMKRGNTINTNNEANKETVTNKDTK